MGSGGCHYCAAERRAKRIAKKCGGARQTMNGSNRPWNTIVFLRLADDVGKPVSNSSVG